MFFSSFALILCVISGLHIYYFSNPNSFTNSHPTLILSFMLVKAGLIIAIFMHMAWERLALIYAIFLPPVFILVFIVLMTIEGDYTFLTREIMFMFPGA